MVQIWVAIITALVGPAVMFFLQLYRDRRGINKELKEIRQELKAVRLANLRHELLFLLEHHPEDEQSIMKVNDEYTSNGGNSYTHEYFVEWLESRKKIKKAKH